jgi:hypothetical protein
MSFVALGGDGLRPTFFELLAAERLMSSLKAAVIYSLAVSTHIVTVKHIYCTARYTPEQGPIASISTDTIPSSFLPHRYTPNEDPV